MGISRLIKISASALLAAGLLCAPASGANVLPISAAPPPSDQLFPVGGPAIAKAQSIAVAYWGATPCGGDITISWGGLPDGVNALSTWWNPVAPYGNAAANDHCVMTLNPAQSFDWPMLCTILVHEYGHLAGHQHATDPADVMYPVYSNPIAQCSAATDPNPPAAVPASQTFAGADPTAGLAPAAHHAKHHGAARSRKKRAAKSARRSARGRPHRRRR